MCVLAEAWLRVQQLWLGKASRLESTTEHTTATAQQHTCSVEGRPGNICSTSGFEALQSPKPLKTALWL